MADGNNVVFLAFKSETTRPGTMAMHACGCCNNKTYTLVEDVPDYYPLVKCAACGQHMGRVGWVNLPDDLKPGTHDAG